MNYVLVVHLWVGILVALCAALLLRRRPGRRITLYLLTLQVALGFWALGIGARAPSAHYSLGILALLGVGAAHGLGAKPGRERAVTIVAAISLLLVLGALALGLKAAGLVP